MRRFLRPGFVPCSVGLALGGCLLGGCAAWPGLDNPRTSIEARALFDTVGGRLQMETADVSGPRRNAWLDAGDSFGLDDNAANVGGRLLIGDGISGFHLEVLQHEFDGKNGLLRSDFGAVPASSAVNSEIDGMRVGVGYHGVFYTIDQIPEVKAHLGLGGSLEYQVLDLMVQDQNSANRQDTSAVGIPIPMIRARIDVEHDAFGARIDFGWSDGDFGDVDGTSRDLELSVRYMLNSQITFTGGWRRLDVPIQGREGPLRYELDVNIQGWFVGVRYTF
jgi:hypothetical protein